MSLKTISLLLLVAINAEAVDSNEAAKAMSKFVHVPGTRMSRPAIPVGNGATSDAMSEAVVHLEKQSQEMKAEYQHLRARIEKLSQADVSASISAPSSSSWFAALIASLGLSATMGVAAVKKYMGQGQQGSESATAFQVPLVARAPQRAGAIVAMAAEPTMSKANDNWDPLNLADGQSSGDKALDLQHGRLIAGMIGVQDRRLPKKMHTQVAAAATAFAPFAALAGGQSEGTGLSLGIDDGREATVLWVIGGFFFFVYYNWAKDQPDSDSDFFSEYDERRL